eukprot:scaffold32530_cov44-Cyclotella_meneghiniana.AAC.3
MGERLFEANGKGLNKDDNFLHNTQSWCAKEDTAHSLRSTNHLNQLATMWSMRYANASGLELIPPKMTKIMNTPSRSLRINEIQDHRKKRSGRGPMKVMKSMEASYVLYSIKRTHESQ